MSRDADLAIKQVLEEHGETWNTGTVWRVQGTAVISHKALERIAGRAGIRFDKPDVLRAERDEAVMLVVGRRGDLVEWSVGECVINQNYRVSGKQAAYPWAMAEKRAKDRVILKLLALHGIAYSEEEADDFKSGAPRPSADRSDDTEIPAGPNEAEARAEFIKASLATIRTKADGKSLREWWQSAEQRQAIADFALSQDEVGSLKAAVTDRLREIGQQAPEAARPRDRRAA